MRVDISKDEMSTLLFFFYLFGETRITIKTNGRNHFFPCTWRILASLMRKYLKIKSLCLFIHIKALSSSIRGGQVLK